MNPICYGQISSYIQVEAILQTSNDICIPETPVELSPTYTPEKNNTKESTAEDDVTVVEQSMDDVLETKTCQSSRSDDTNIGKSSPQCHSSPIAKEFNSDELDHVNSSPIILPSPSSLVEMMSSPERSPLPEYLDDFDMDDESNDFSKAQVFPAQNLHNTSLSNSPDINPNKYIAKDMNVDSSLNTCISIVSPESKTTTSPLYTSNTDDTDKIKEAVVCSGLKRGNSKLANEITVMEPGRRRNKLPDENEDDSSSDVFATSFDSTTKQSPVYYSKHDMNVDSCLDMDISNLSPKCTPTSPTLYSPSSKDEDIGIKEAEITLLKADSDRRGRRPRGANTTQSAKQTLVFISKGHDRGEEMDNDLDIGYPDSEIGTMHKDVHETTTRQSCTLTNQIDMDDSSLQSKDEMDFDQGDRRTHSGKLTNKDVNETTKRKNTPSIKVQSGAGNSWYDDQSFTSKYAHETPRRRSSTRGSKADSWLVGSSFERKKTPSTEDQNDPSRDVIETSRRKSCTGTNKADSWLDDSSFEINNSPGTAAQNDTQEDCYDDKHVNKTVTHQSCTTADKADSWLGKSPIKSNNKINLQAQMNDEENFYDDDQFIDCYNDGGFNCDIDDYFSYDAHSTIQDGNVVAEGEKPGTSSSALHTMESNVEEETLNNEKSLSENSKEKIGKGKKNVQATENKKENMSKDVKKGNNKTGGKIRKSEKDVAGKQANTKNKTQEEFKLRDPRTPMLDYSNMATPDLKVSFVLAS